MGVEEGGMVGGGCREADNAAPRSGVERSMQRK
jgi:hypothetical protein